MKNHFNLFTEILLSYRNTEILEIRAKLGKILLNLFQLNFKISSNLQKEIFFFYFNNFRVENYEMNFSASEFFLFFLENEEEFLKKNLIDNSLFSGEFSYFEKKFQSTMSLEDDKEKEWTNLADLFEKYLKE